MVGSKSDFELVKKYFKKLMGQNTSKRDSEIKKLFSEGKINQLEFDMLKNMLQADEDTQSDGLTSDFQAVISDVASESGFKNDCVYKQVGPYKIISTLGEGGMGQVYLAERNDGVFEQKVALKLPHSSFNNQIMQRFENERQILAQLTHNNIAHLLDGGTAENNQPYIAMEYIQGKNIDKYCTKTIPDLNDRLKLILQICSAVSFSHQQLVLHRDLKPSNILVTETGQVKLLDFGIAKLLDFDEEAKANNTATQIMTRYYASPEQLQGKPASTHSDMFSLAIIAYELITGYHPFQHKDQHEREQNLISGKIMRVTQRTDKTEALLPELAKIPTGKLQGDLENILLKALSVDPIERYVSVKDFADDLSNFIENKPVSARKPSTVYYFSKWIQRHKTVTVLIFTTLITLITATIYSIGKANYAIEQQNLAVKQQKIAESETEKATQISNFLKNLFDKAKPESSLDQITAQDLLMQGFEYIEKDKFSFPETKYELLDVMHNSLIAIGKYKASDSVIDNQLKECRKTLSKSHKTCVRLLIQKSKIYHFLYKSEDSLKLLYEAESIVLERKKIDRKELVSIYAEMNADLLNLGMKKEANEYMLKILEIENASKSPDYRRLFEVTHELATIDIYNNDYESAWQRIKKINDYVVKFPIEKRDQWQKHVHSLTALYYFASNNPIEAIVFRKKRLDFESQFEVKPKSFGRTLMILGDMSIRAGYFDQAEKYLQDSYDFFKNNISKSHYQQYQAIGKKIYLFLLIGKEKEALLEYEILSQAQQIDSNLHRYAESSDYLKAKALIDIIDMHTDEKLKYYQKIRSELIQTESKPKHLLFLMVLEIKIKLSILDKSEIEELLASLNEFLMSYPNDFFEIKNFYQIIKNDLK